MQAKQASALSEPVQGRAAEIGGASAPTAARSFFPHALTPEYPTSAIALPSRTSAELEAISQRAQFDALEPEWNALFDRVGRPCDIFQSYGWLWHWANHYLDERSRLSIVVGRRGGRSWVRSDG
jgi:hypothetical protein